MKSPHSISRHVAFARFPSWPTHAAGFVCSQPRSSPPPRHCSRHPTSSHSTLRSLLCVVPSLHIFSNNLTSVLAHNCTLSQSVLSRGLAFSLINCVLLLTRTVPHIPTTSSKKWLVGSLHHHHIRVLLGILSAASSPSAGPMS